MGQWSALVEGRFGRNYELFEAYVVKNVLLLPDAFVMPHHRGLESAVNVESEELLDGELADLAGRLQAVASGRRGAGQQLMAWWRAWGCRRAAWMPA